MTLALHNLSLWELAHRWHGHDPHQSDDPRTMPLEVKDTLRNLAQEIAEESLYSTLLLSREAEREPDKGFGPWWRPWGRKPRVRRAVADYRDEWEQCVKHNLINREFLQSVQIPYWDLEYWCGENHVPMPEFWVRSVILGGNQFPLPGARPLEVEPEELVSSDDQSEEAQGDDSPSAQQKAAHARHEVANELTN